MAKLAVPWTRDNLIVTIPASSGLSEFANVNFTGWTIGGGLEWLALPNVSLFAEYEFIDFHAKSVTFTTPPGNVGAPDVNMPGPPGRPRVPTDVIEPREA